MDLYLNAQSLHHPVQKLTVLTTLLLRAQAISDQEHLLMELAHLNQTFLWNVYARQQITQIWKPCVFSKKTFTTMAFLLYTGQATLNIALTS